MSEIILGTGHHKTIGKVIATVEGEVSKREGIPRKLVCRGDWIDFVAERADFEKEFDRFELKIRPLTADWVAAIKAVAAEYADVSTVVEESGLYTIQCPPLATPSSPKSKAAAEKYVGCITLPEIWRIYGDNFRIDPINVELMFQALIQYKASDIHLTPGETPVFRVDGQTMHSEVMAPLSSVQITALIRQITPDLYWDEFVKTKQTSFNFHQVGLGYSRVSAFHKSGAVHCTFRFLPEKIPSFEDLNVPRDMMVKLASYHHGLVLVTGMTGSGKTTTSATLLDYINSTKSLHILSIENPIEFVHVNKKSLMSQRCLGVDVDSFNEAVTGALRHDPDVIFIGEMRDPDTIRAAINAAATGHLVISTLHSNTASETINRIVSFFDPVERDLVKLQLRDSIRCIICQRLVPKIGGGRVPALEFMFNDIKPINDGIIDGDTDAIRIGMQQTVGSSFLFESYLYGLVKSKKIDYAHAQLFSTDQSILDQMHMGTYSVPRLESLKALRGGL
ncbi:MAG TPA: PilT/PilU family type 4a pilus ATPase [Candidatus Bathyarchaeia archaeon]|nr:PilT/PilU family type 4a pilus ATPase [Candidatus Bathyarchaeia archaeon]